MNSNPEAQAESVESVSAIEEIEEWIVEVEQGAALAPLPAEILEAIRNGDPAYRHWALATVATASEALSEVDRRRLIESIAANAAEVEIASRRRAQGVSPELAFSLACECVNVEDSKAVLARENQKRAAMHQELRRALGVATPTPSTQCAQAPAHVVMAVERREAMAYVEWSLKREYVGADGLSAIAKVLDPQNWDVYFDSLFPSTYAGGQLEDHLCRYPVKAQQCEQTFPQPVPEKVGSWSGELYEQYGNPNLSTDYENKLHVDLSSEQDRFQFDYDIGCHYSGSFGRVVVDVGCVDAPLRSDQLPIQTFKRLSISHPNWSPYLAAKLLGLTGLQQQIAICALL